MEETITITLAEEIRSAMNDAIREEGISPDDLIGEAVRQYLFSRRFRLLRERMLPKAQAQGILTDQDVFDLVS